MESSNESWFDQVKMGPLVLPNRIVMAAMTRCRSDPRDLAPNDLHVQYYTQRADAAFILTECVHVDQRGRGFPRAAGLHNEKQAEGWKKVTDSIHKKGGRIVA